MLLGSTNLSKNNEMRKFRGNFQGKFGILCCFILHGIFVVINFIKQHFGISFCSVV